MRRIRYRSIVMDVSKNIFDKIKEKDKVFYLGEEFKVKKVTKLDDDRYLAYNDKDYPINIMLLADENRKSIVNDISDFKKSLEEK